MKQKPITLENINDIEKKLGDLAKDGAFLSAEYFIGKLEEIKVLTDKPEI